MNQIEKELVGFHGNYKSHGFYVKVKLYDKLAEMYESICNNNPATAQKTVVTGTFDYVNSSITIHMLKGVIGECIDFDFEEFEII